jgi:hypothetical protein
MKLKDNEFMELRNMVEEREIIKRKWVETLFHYKHQEEALGS